jgi:uncharacterized HAD superfamily protein
MGRLNFGIDIDGVLAKFEAGFAPILTDMYGVQFPKLWDMDFPSVWDWPKEAGLTNEEIHAAWQRVLDSHYFWSSLPTTSTGAYDIRLLNELRWRGHNVYFITHRFGKRAKQATEQWFIDNGMFNPTVLLCEQKHLCAVGLNLDVFVDDKVENVAEVLQFTIDAGIETRCYIFDRPYNRGYNDPRVRRVKSVTEVINDVL